MKLTTGKDLHSSVSPTQRNPFNSALTDVQDDGLSLGDMGTLLETFGPEQPLDFYGAMRASLYDNQIRRWIESEIVGDAIINEDANLAELSRRLVDK